jgi:hypothetical protein
MFQAEPTSGKTWIALAAAEQVLAMGGAVVYIDFEDTARGVIGRALTLGIKPEVLAHRFVYLQPAGPFAAAEVVALRRVLDDLNPDLVIIDGVGEALARDGLRENEAADYMSWVDRVVRPIARTGAAVVLIDHVVKNKDDQGRWARGTGAKLASVDGASYQIKVVTPFSRSRPGKVKIVAAKDRPGQFAIGEVVAMVTITPAADGARVTIDIAPNVDDRTPGDSWKPTHLMERISQIIEESTTPLTATEVRTMLPHSKANLISDAVARLVAEGYVGETRTRPKTLRSLAPYREPGTTVAPPHDDNDAPPDYTDEALFDG